MAPEFEKQAFETLKSNKKLILINSHDLKEKNTINNLYSQKKDLIVPLLEQYGCRFTNIWTDIDEKGYYRGSEFYDKIINQEYKGICNIPYFYNTCLISSTIKDNYDLEDIYKYNEFMDTDLDMGMCLNIRNMDLQIYLYNILFVSVLQLLLRSFI